ncbi:MAG: hypothetical protein ACO3PR_00020 [Limisphaerales bacterium]
MRLVLPTNPPIAISISPQQLRAALPDDYDLIDLKSPEHGGKGRASRGKRGHIDYSRELVPNADRKPTPLRDYLTQEIFPLFPQSFTAASLLLKLRQKNILAAEVVRNNIVMGRTLAAMIRDDYPGLSIAKSKGGKQYRYDEPLGDEASE